MRSFFTLARSFVNKDCVASTPESAIIKAVSSSSNKSSSTFTPTKIALMFEPVRDNPRFKRPNHETFSASGVALKVSFKGALGAALPDPSCTSLAGSNSEAVSATNSDKASGACSDAETERSVDSFT